MSTRSGKRSGKPKGSGRSGEYAWSDWFWDQEGYQYYRFRPNSRGDYDYQYQQGATEEGGSTPRGAASSADFALLPNNPTPDTEYYGNTDYVYQDSSQTSTASDNLSVEFARASLDEKQVQSTQSVSYENQQSRVEQSDGASSSEYIATQPIPIPQNPSSSAHNPATDDYSSSSTSTITGTRRDTQQLMPSGISSGYVAPNQSSYYPEAPYGANYGSSYGHPGPSMVDTRGIPLTYSGYPTSSRSYADSQTSIQQTYDSSAATGSGANTPKASHMTIRATEGTEEALDPKFRVHKSNHFTPGQVFKVLWFEPQGENAAQTNATEVTTFSWDVGNKKHGQRAHGSIRRFVIVAADYGHCQCLPILTYHRQATTKSGVKRDDHAIVYTGDKPPREIEGEEHLRLRPIQVIMKTPRDKLEKESRINYAKIYTVEHNVKVHFIGHVARASEHALAADFDTVWMRKRQLNPDPPGYSASNTVDSSRYIPGGYQ